MRIALLVIVLMALCCQAHAAAVISVDYSLDAGIWTYIYEIDNSGGSFDVDYFELSGLAENVYGACWPDKWNFAWSIGGIAYWETPIWESEFDIVETGSKLVGFTLKSPTGPAPVNWFIQGVTGAASSTINGPAYEAVPEASSLALFGLALTGLGFRRITKERRKYK